MVYRQNGTPREGRGSSLFSARPVHITINILFDVGLPRKASMESVHKLAEGVRAVSAHSTFKHNWNYDLMVGFFLARIVETKIVETKNR